MTEDRYQAYWVPQARNVLRQLAEKAMEVGLLEALKVAVAQTQVRLEQEPLSVGELYDRKGDVMEHVGANALFWIDFATEVNRKVVVVRRCWATASGGL